MRNKTCLFILIIIMLTGWISGQQASEKIKVTRATIKELYKEIVNKGTIPCDEMKDALTLLEAYNVLTNMDPAADNVEKKKAGDALKSFTKTTKEKCPAAIPTEPSLGVIIDRRTGGGISVSTKVPSFVYSSFYMSGKLKEKYLEGLPKEQREYAEKWFKEHRKEAMEINTIIDAKLKDVKLDVAVETLAKSLSENVDGVEALKVKKEFIDIQKMIKENESGELR